MKPRFGLRARMLMAYAGLIIVGFVLLALLAGRQITQGATEEYYSSLPTQASLVAQALTEPLEHYAEGDLDRATLEAAVVAYAEKLGVHITLIDDSGRVILDSEGIVPGGDLLIHPEVEAALRGDLIYRIYPDETGANRLYTAAPMLEDDEVFSIVRMSAPAAVSRERLSQRWLTLALGAVLLGVLALIASWWLAASQTRPLEQLRHSAIRLANGDFSQRIPQDRTDEVGELATAFNHMAGQVQAMIEEQRAFASNAAHELRTPLTAIRLRSEALRDDTVDVETAKQYAVEIDDEVARMSNLVNDLILISRLDAGHPELGHEQLDPARLARALVSELRPRTAQQKVVLSLETPSELPSISASQGHLRVVFYNLLDNALKYTSEGGEVRWRLWTEDGWLRATITDNGQGIAPEDLPHVFERFYRADKAHARTISGVGLGLALVRSVLSVYGGRITVASRGLGYGTVAEVWWPLVVESEATA
ncbi:MAG: HAMP domain-containing protein [Candidatus Promineofilum sp.]|nr:HAMP domain-containing protein [Promineifilum sp.]